MTESRVNCSFRTGFRLVVEPGYLPVALPKLNVVAINKLFCPFRGLGIVGAIELNRLKEMAV